MRLVSLFFILSSAFSAQSKQLEDTHYIRSLHVERQELFGLLALGGIIAGSIAGKKKSNQARKAAEEAQRKTLEEERKKEAETQNHLTKLKTSLKEANTKLDQAKDEQEELKLQLQQEKEEQEKKALEDELKREQEAIARAEKQLKEQEELNNRLQYMEDQYQGELYTLKKELEELKKTNTAAYEKRAREITPETLEEKRQHTYDKIVKLKCRRRLRK